MAGCRTSVGIWKVGRRNEVGAWRMHAGRGVCARWYGRNEWRGILRCHGVIWVLPRRVGLLSPRGWLVVWGRWRNDRWCEAFRGGEGRDEGCGRWFGRIVEHFGRVSEVYMVCLLCH